MKDNNRRYSIMFIILIAAFIVAILTSIILGQYSIGIGDFLKIIMSRLEFLDIETTGLSSAEKVLMEVRLPRVAAAVLIGASLSVAGVCYQGMFRNPIVSPDILGASTGAGFGAAIAILVGASYFYITTTAFIFGMLAVALAYILSRLSKTSEMIAMILAGMVISSLFSSATSFIKLVADTDNQLPAITYWLMGQLSSIKHEDIVFILIPILLGMLPLCLISWRLNLLTVDDETARSVGINIRALRLVVVICATMLTAASVSVSGMIGWVGLVIPHFCRMIFGYDYKRLIPATALMGSTFLLVVDDIARMASTAEIPIGILTSFVGAPLFLYLLITGGRKR